MKASDQKVKRTQVQGTPPPAVKELFIGPDTGTKEEALKSYLPIVEMVVKKEYKTIPSYLAEYGELINIGLLTVNKLLFEANKNKRTYNSSYIAQAVKWAIKDELRVKYNWYGVKQTHGKETDSVESSGDESTSLREIGSEEDLMNVSKEEASEKVFETILYLEDLNRETVSKEQMTTDELARLELMELKCAVRKAIDKLPPKHKKVIEMRFYEGKKGNDIASGLGVTPSRVSHIIQDAIEKVRQMLLSEGFS